MGRGRRYISEDGLMLCKRCSKFKHLNDFYCLHPSEGVYWEDPDGTLYGRPASYCKECYAQRSKEAAERRRKQKHEEQVGWVVTQAEAISAAREAVRRKAQQQKPTGPPRPRMSFEEATGLTEEDIRRALEPDM